MKIRNHTDLEVYKIAFEAAMDIYELTKGFLKDERFSLTDQVRRSSRSICANLAEAFRKRRYPKNFVSKLADCEGETAETQVWLQFAFKCDYIDRDKCEELYKLYGIVLGKLVTMGKNPENWTI